MRALLAVAAVLVFLAGTQLFVFSTRTARYFAWTIDPPMTAAFLGAHYNDHAGLLAMGVPVDGPETCADDADLRNSADPFPASDGRYAAPPPGWRRACGWR